MLDLLELRVQLVPEELKVLLDLPDQKGIREIKVIKD
jgi:hypothetical protein